MDDICLVIDMDGHRIQKTFYCRELGYAELSTPRMERGSMRFDLRPFAKSIRPEDRPTISYCERVLGVLKFWPDRAELERGEIFRLDDLEALVRNLYCEFRRPGKRVVVAYKGGHVEKDLLEELDIPCVNLEMFGCPKFEKLPRDPAVRDCGYHHHIGGGPAHCPMKECAAFAAWIREQQHRRGDEPSWRNGGCGRTVAAAADPEQERIVQLAGEEWWN